MKLDRGRTDLHFMYSVQRGSGKAHLSATSLTALSVRVKIDKNEFRIIMLDKILVMETLHILYTFFISIVLDHLLPTVQPQTFVE
jgi:alpha-D-ribose 1-methylphosphonate 5-triphosphate synthase subunit PhnI